MKLRYIPLLVGSALAMLVGSCRTQSVAPSATSHPHLVILHTNDTHSQIEPDRHDLGGIVRRKVLVDSVRASRPDVLLIDAGDAVQGSLYYTLFDGEVERVLMNAMGYDIRILGNHEFDKGLPLLAKEWKQITGTRLSTNYDFTGTPLDGIFVTSEIRDIDGHKIGFIGINLDPHGIVFDHNYTGITYSPAIESANAEAARLRQNGAEMVIAVTHIGYEEDDPARPDDIDLAKASSDIDIIIGGHSHTVVTPSADPSAPASVLLNSKSQPVTVVQTGSTGTYLGHIDIDLVTKSVIPSLIKVDSRLDDRTDAEFAALITPYRHGVDSVRSLVIGKTDYTMLRKSAELLNFFSDYVKRQASEYLPGRNIDLSIMNKGGLRADLPAGAITRGSIIDIAPFDNSIVVMEISGKDLLDNFKVMAMQEGQGVSENVRATFDPSTHEVIEATVDGLPIDPEKSYTLATIDYLALGGDYMEPLKNGKIIARSPGLLHQSLSDAITAGKVDDLLASPSTTVRFAGAK
ncbi:MAG: bifunctional metallophosphatase/5'-nucleotidase [Duncaniella sp.]|nr:bifunctional metallophosphatase/5'-nucleotidase [Duncaniella sp.]